MIQAEVTITKDKSKEIAQEIHEAIKTAIIKACEDTKALAQDKAPVDTGYLKGSITEDLSNLSNLEGEVAVGAEYGAHVEFGTTKTPAQPYITPAFEEVSESFEAVVSALISRIT